MSLRLPHSGARRCRICVVCDHDSLREVLADAELVILWARVPDALVELRLDAYADLSLPTLARTLTLLRPSRCLVTFRDASEGGGAQDAGDAASRFAYYALAVKMGAYGVDTELARLQRCAPLRALWQRPGATRRVVSVHHMADGACALQLAAQRDAAEQLGADVVKVVVSPQNLRACAPLVALLRATSERGCPLIGLGMGEYGRWSRILAPRWPQAAPWTYARRQKAPPDARGLWTWQVLADTYRLADIDAHTPVYGVIGAPIAQSHSPALHNRWLAQRRLPGVYLPFLVRDELGYFLDTLAPQLGVVGLSVTHPHKVAAAQACGVQTALAQRAGAVNTLVRRPPLQAAAARRGCPVVR